MVAERDLAAAAERLHRQALAAAGAEQDLSAEDLADLRASRARLDAVREGRDEWLSHEDVRARFAAATPLAFWRSKRGLTQAELAAAAGLSQGYLSDLESGRREGKLATLKRLAERLAVSLGDLA